MQLEFPQFGVPDHSLFFSRRLENSSIAFVAKDPILLRNAAYAKISGGMFRYFAVSLTVVF